MSDWLAVTSPHYFTDTLKREVLFFDRIAYPGLVTSLNLLRSGPNMRLRYGGFADELETLADQGIAFDPYADGDPPFPISGELARLMNQYNERHQPVLALARAAQVEFSAGRVSATTALDEIDRGMSELFGWGARINAMILREQQNIAATPLCPLEMLSASTPFTAQREDVVQLVIDGVPVPSDTTPLSDVLAFREEARSNGWLQGLRVWMNDVANTERPINEVSDRLEYLVNQYETALSHHRMTRDTTMLETFIFPANGVVDYLTKLGSKLFTTRRAQLELLKAERELPGREVAYVVRAAERFGR
jgi:hypothetical protein